MPDLDGGLAIAEPVETSTGAETIETSVDSGAEGESSSEVSNEVDSSAENGELTPKTIGKGSLKLADIAKTQVDALKAIDPALPGAIQKAAHELGRFYGEFPGGLKEAVGLKHAFAEIGGQEGIKELQEAVSDYGSLEQLFEKGDGAFMDRLADTAPASFSQIMPAGLAKWKATDPEMYEHTQAKVFVQTIDQFKLSDTLESLWSKATDTETKNALAHAWQQLDGLRQKAAKVPERKTNPQDEALTKREQALATREQQAFIKPIATEGRQHIQTITDREMMQSYQWDKTDSSVKEAVADRVRADVIKASTADKIFCKEYDRLKDRGDSAGLSRHIKNFQDRVTPAIIQRVAKLFAVKPKNAGAISIKKPVANGTSTGNAAPQGWTQVARQPQGADIDMVAMGRNYEDMIMSNRAILKDKRRVTWL